MEQTTQGCLLLRWISGPNVRRATNKPLPATEKDFHTRPSRTQSSGFRIAIVIAIIVFAGCWILRLPLFHQL